VQHNNPPGDVAVEHFKVVDEANSIALTPEYSSVSLL